MRKIETSLFKGKSVAEIRFQVAGESAEERYSFEEARKMKLQPWFAKGELERGTGNTAESIITKNDVENFIQDL